MERTAKLGGSICLNGESGVTLPEVIISLAILAGAALSLLGLFGSSLRVNSAVQHSTIAFKAGQEVMEQIMAMDYTSVPAQNGLTFDVIGIKELPNPTIGSVTVTDVSGGAGRLYEIVVRISYNGDGAIPKLNINLTARRAKP